MGWMHTGKHLLTKECRAELAQALRIRRRRRKSRIWDENQPRGLRSQL